MKRIGEIKNWSSGISTGSKKIAPENSFAFGRAIDFRSEPSELSVQPRTVRISGSEVQDLPMWADIACDNLYFHGDTGRIYRVDENDTVVHEYTVSDSQGNGIAYLPEDGFLYIPSNTSITRRSQACGEGEYTQNFLESEGGEPTNTNSLLLNGTTQYASRADTPSLSLTGDLTLSPYIKPLSLPTGNERMVLISKWNENSNKRSYKLEIVPTSAKMGDGANGPLVVSTNTTETVIDANLTGTIGENTVELVNIDGSFAVGQWVYIHQTRGQGHGQKQVTEIIAINGTTLTLAEKLTFSPKHSTSASGDDKAQIRVLPRYTDVTINTGVTYTGKSWNGFKGGILAFVASGDVTVNGTITISGSNGQYSANTVAGATGGGFRGGRGYRATSSSHTYAHAGEGFKGAQLTNENGAYPGMYERNDNAGSGSTFNTGDLARSGGGGGNGTPGNHGTNGKAGTIAGTDDLTTLDLGGGGGGGSRGRNKGLGVGSGASGGGIIDITANAITVHPTTGFILSNGGNAGIDTNTSGQGSEGGGASGGAASGGSIAINCRQASLGENRVQAKGGIGTTATNNRNGNGGQGRIYVSYFDTVTGTTTPSLISGIDTVLGLDNGYALRLSLSADGQNFESYTQRIENPQDFWNRFTVTWDASESKAVFYQNNTPLGIRTGSLTAIHDNDSAFAIGASFDGSGNAQDFYHGYIDDTSVFSVIRSENQVKNFVNRVLTGFENGLVAYYPFDASLEDAQTDGNNDLTGVGSPEYSDDVAFSGVSTRSDEDVFLDNDGDTYTLKTAVSEDDADRIYFTPTKEPLKSIALNIDTVGTGDWTIVIHDVLNRVLTSMTVDNDDLQTGIYEFIFNESSRPIRDAEYHIHVYSTVADGKIVSSTQNEASTAYLKTYFQILVDDKFHPSLQFLNFLVIGNERYLAVLEAGSLYNPHRITLPSGYRIRSLAYWDEFLAIGASRGDSIVNNDNGKVFFWDGTSDTYAQPLNIPQGAINALFGAQGTLYIAAGSRGKVLRYTGGSDRLTGGPEAGIAIEIPEKSKGDTLEIAPGAMTMYQALLRIGATYDTNSETIHQGIYSFGQKNNLFPMSLGFDNPLSIGDSTSNMVKIGSLFTRGNRLYCGYQNANSFGIDMVSPSNDPYDTATIELLISDLTTGDYKLPLVFKVEHEELEDGQGIVIKYKPNRSSEWIELQRQTNVGAIETRAIMNKRLREAQFAVDIIGSPTITGMSAETEDERGSRQI